MRLAVRQFVSVLLVVIATSSSAREPVTIAGHAARFDVDGRLMPWTSWTHAIDLEMHFYETAPLDHGYPRFVTETFLQADWTPDPSRRDTIPATQNGMGILSYLAWYEFNGRRDAKVLRIAKTMADYLTHETLTPTDADYPNFPRSTGTRGQFPLAADTGAQSDRPYEIEPDKGGIVGYAFMRLSDVSGEKQYLDHALHIARVLAVHQGEGDATHSPWPFRVDYRTGAARGDVSGNMVYIIRLYDTLIAHGHSEFKAPRAALWHWIKRFQIPSATTDGALFAQFFEDHDAPTNRTAWAPLNLARYLLEKRAAIDPDWRRDAGALIDFVRRNFTHTEFGIVVCHEQDEDHDAWGGVNSTYGAVLARYAKAIGSTALAEEARQALDFTLYSIDAAGRSRDLFSHPAPGGWQEDAHTDVIHNVVDAMQTLPDWR